MRYVMLSQTIVSLLETDHVDSIETALKKAGVLHRDTYVKEFNDALNVPTRAAWGTGLFQVETDGSLCLIHGHWDSGD